MIFYVMFIGESRNKKQHGQYSKDDYVCDRELAVIQGMTRRKMNNKRENIFDVVASWVSFFFIFI